MAAASIVLASELVKYALTNEAMGARPTGWVVRLHGADPGEGGANEISGSSYVQQSATFTRTDNSAANTAAINYPTVTGVGYTVSHVSIYDTEVTPRQLYRGALAVPKTLAVGEALSFAIGELIVTEL